MHLPSSSFLLPSVLLFALALAVRLPDLTLIPRYTDEGFEAMWAIDIAQGQRLPLDSVIPYGGPLFTYLLAVLFTVFGVNPLIPRLTVAVAGALLVVVTYTIGRVIWGRGAGLVAAGLTLTNPTLILFSSRYAWSNSLTPLFLMLTLLTLYLGVARRRNGLLALSAFLAALALQTHPTAFAPLVGMLLWLLAQPGLRVWLRPSTVLGGVGLFALGYAPLLVAYLRPDSALHATIARFDNRISLAVAPADYLGRLGALLRYVAYVVGGVVPPATWPMRALEVVLVGLAMIGLVVAWRRGPRLVPLAATSGILCLPLLLADYTYRYFDYLAPLAYLAVGCLADTRMEEEGRRKKDARVGTFVSLPASSLPSFFLPASSLPSSSFLLPLFLLIALPLTSSVTYRRYAEAEGLTNQAYHRLIATVEVHGACGPGLWVDEVQPAWGSPTQTQAYYTSLIVHHLLRLSGCAHHFGPVGKPYQPDTTTPVAWLIASDITGPTLAGISLTRVATFDPPPIATTRVGVTLYRID